MRAPASPPAAVYGVRDGTVTGFDEHVGAGTVVDAVDAREWWFHCTSIANGSRSIVVGSMVQFRVVPGTTGLEAVDLHLAGTPPAR